MDVVPSQPDDAYVIGVEGPRKKVGLAIYRQINRRWDLEHEDGLRHYGDEQVWEDMKEEFLLRAIPAGIPDPSNGKQFSAKIESFFRCGYTASFIECLARRENQFWHADIREKVARLERLFRKVAEWNASWEQKLSRFCRDATCYHNPRCFGYDRGCQYPIGFADFEKDPGQWQLDVVRCFKFGFNVGFVEDIAKIQDKLWTQQMRFSAQQLEREFHRPALVQKYKEGKSTQTITEEMLEETGLKLSSRTLNDQFRKWGESKGTCSISKLDRVPTATPYTNATCHPGDTWYAIERPLPRPMTPFNPYLSSQGPNLDVLRMPNIARSVCTVSADRSTRDVIPTNISSVNAEKEHVSTMLHLDSGPADWREPLIGYPGRTLNSMLTESVTINQNNTNITGSLNNRPSMTTPFSMNRSDNNSKSSTMSSMRKQSLSLDVGQRQWWGEILPPQEALGTISTNHYDYDVDIDDGCNTAEAPQQAKIMRLRSERHAIADRLAAIDLELNTELRKSGFSDDSGYFSSAVSLASSLGSKRRRMMDYDEQHAESIVEEGETT